MWWRTSVFVLLSCWMGAISAACSVNTIAVAFGAYNPNVGSPADATGAVNVTCAPNAAYRVRLDPGANSNGVFTQRAMLEPVRGVRIYYNLYLDPALTQLWGDGTGGTQIVSGNGVGLNQIMRIYGRIPPRQNVSEGSYSDSVTVTVEW